jgi:hypothetical protein
MLFTKRDCLDCPALTKVGFQAAGLIIDPGMDDSAVAACLMHRWTGFFFQHHDMFMGKTILQLPSGRYTDNPSAYNDKIIYHCLSSL